MARSAPKPRQAACVAIGGRGVLIEGPSGAGKSGLVLELVDRGAQFVGDDGILLQRRGKRLLAHPHPRIHGLIEVRNLGLLSLPCLDEVVVALVVRLDEDAPRYIEQAEVTEIEGVPIPTLRIWPHGGPIAIKTELGLQRFGLTI